MYLWESDIQESVVFEPIEIRGKKGRKKMKKVNAAIYIPNMDAENFEKICNEKGLQFVYVEVPEHGRLIDADALIEDLERQCKEVFRIDAVSPNDYWITRNEACNEALWKSWVESFGEYLKTTPTIIPTDKEKF